MALLTRLMRAVGRRLQPLYAPDAEQDRARLDAFIADQKSRLESLENRAARQEKQIERTLETLGALRVDGKRVREGFAALDAKVRRSIGFSDRVLRRVTDRQQEWRAEKALDRLGRLAAGQGPIVAGPWTGEVGFELIYWVPFVRWFVDHYGVDPSRLVIVSRGGAEPWYDGICGRYLDAFELAGPDEFRQATGAVKKKQRTVRLFDRQLLQRSASRLSTGTPSRRSSLDGRAGLLHPALMYHLLTPFWRRAAGPALPEQYGHYRRYEPPPLDPSVPPLPERYVAVRFYYSDCFPESDANRAFARRIIESFAQHSDVVVIAPNLHVDDHRDAAVATLPRVHVIADLAPARNLAVQTAVIARASTFVGTYGGFSYLAPLYGVDSVAFYSEANFYRHHMLMAQEIAARIGGGSLTPLHIQDVERLRGLTGDVAALRHER